ncbi:hypothetical protein GGR50DRAFT_4810 [Xylaria sp. CBS 124048]|nr:hypothetical protein GGR50DRAFT_4810 [Xylaria sp. CBS 124048]
MRKRLSLLERDQPRSGPEGRRDENITLIRRHPPHSTHPLFSSAPRPRPNGRVRLYGAIDLLPREDRSRAPPQAIKKKKKDLHAERVLVWSRRLRGINDGLPLLILSIDPAAAAAAAAPSPSGPATPAGPATAAGGGIALLPYTTYPRQFMWCIWLCMAGRHASLWCTCKAHQCLVALLVGVTQVWGSCSQPGGQCGRCLCFGCCRGTHYGAREKQSRASDFMEGGSDVDRPLLG